MNFLCVREITQIAKFNYWREKIDWPDEKHLPCDVSDLQRLGISFGKLAQSTYMVFHRCECADDSGSRRGSIQ